MTLARLDDCWYANLATHCPNEPRTLALISAQASSNFLVDCEFSLGGLLVFGFLPAFVFFD